MRGASLATAGIILCGGQSTRMGRPKAWLPFAGELLLPRVVRDAAKGRGPLQGLAVGLDALRGQADTAYASACDVPFLRPAFVRRLMELLGDQAICVPHVGGYHHPLAAVYRIDVVETVMRLLAEGRLRTLDLFQEAPTRVVEAAELIDVDPTMETLRNLNTPEEYEAALREMKCRLRLSEER